MSTQAYKVNVIKFYKSLKHYKTTNYILGQLVIHLFVFAPPFV